MFSELEEIGRRPAPFEALGAADLWCDEHVSARMLACHLDPVGALSSRPHDFIDRSAAWIQDRFELRSGRQVLDLGCGPGLYTMRFAAAGARATGVDFSARSIRHARKSAAAAGLDLEHVQADYLEFETDERFELITMIMCDFCVLSPVQRAALLAKMRTWLRPGGRLLFDAYTLHAFDARAEASAWGWRLMDGFWAPGSYFGFHSTFRYEDEKVVLDKYTIVEEAQTRVVHNWLQYFDPDDLQGELDAAGLRVVERLGDVAGSGYDAGADEFAVVAARG